MKSKVLIGIIVALILLGLGKLYMQDSETVEQAFRVDKFLKDYCRQHQRYPEYETVENNFPGLYPEREWYYWINETQTSASFQYPIILPLPQAPGRAKISEFIPVIYAYVVRNPCQEIF